MKRTIRNFLFSLVAILTLSQCNGSDSNSRDDDFVEKTYTYHSQGGFQGIPGVSPDSSWTLSLKEFFTNDIFLEAEVQLGSQLIQGFATRFNSDIEEKVCHNEPSDEATEVEFTLPDGYIFVQFTPFNENFEPWDGSSTHLFAGGIYLPQGLDSAYGHLCFNYDTPSGSFMSHTVVSLE